MNKKYQAPAYPRVIVSKKRHAALAKEARETGKTIEQVAEAKFKV